MTVIIIYNNPTIILLFSDVLLYIICTAFTNLNNMDIHPFIIQHEIHISIDNTRQNQHKDNQGNIGRDIHNGVIPNNLF